MDQPVPRMPSRSFVWSRLSSRPRILPPKIQPPKILMPRMQPLVTCEWWIVRTQRSSPQARKFCHASRRLMLPSAETPCRVPACWPMVPRTCRPSRTPQRCGITTTATWWMPIQRSWLRMITPTYSTASVIIPRSPRRTIPTVTRGLPRRAASLPAVPLLIPPTSRARKPSAVSMPR